MGDFVYTWSSIGEGWLPTGLPRPVFVPIVFCQWIQKVQFICDLEWLPPVSTITGSGGEMALLIANILTLITMGPSNIFETLARMYRFILVIMM